MWFKNLILLRLNDKSFKQPEELDQNLQAHTFRPCSGTEPRSQGWVAPIGEEGAPLVHAANGFMMLCLKTEEKIVPGSVIKEQLDAKVADMERKENRKVRKKEKDSFKDEIVHTLLSRAFTRAHYTYAYVDPTEGWLVVNTSSKKKADDFTEFLRKSVGSLKIEVPKLQAVAALLTDWVKTGEYPKEYVIEDACVLQDTKETGSIRCQRQNLMSKEITSLLDSGREVVQLALSWRDQLAFVIKEDFSLKSLRFLDTIQDQAHDLAAESQAERFDADFSVMTLTLRGFIADLMHTFAKAEE
jgi:recombination associated protein RdgC